MKAFLLWAIRLYQRTLSRDHGYRKDQYPFGHCKFTPTCSEYFYSAVEKGGVAKGSLRGVWRILRCNPWSKGGHDPAP